jgi:hypothetical protein
LYDIECSLIERWHWSLYDIDRTEVESILGYINHHSGWKNGTSKPAMKSAYAEDLDL